jgi:hypothetical protein
VAGIVLGVGAVSGVAAGSSGIRAPVIATGTSTTTGTLPLQAVIVSLSTAGSVLTMRLACKNGSAGDLCNGPITLIATGGKKVAAASYSVATGDQTTVTIPLNRTGKTLLSKSYKLAATLTLAGTSTLTRSVHFRYLVIVARISFTWMFDPAYTRAEVLSVSGIPAGGVVQVTCHGGGCPFTSKTFSPSSAGNVNLEPSFKSSKLRPGTTLVIKTTHTNYVGKVSTFAVHSGRAPSELTQCLPPGASTPSKCA